MESLTNASQNVNIAVPSLVSDNLRMRRRNGMNQYQFEQQLANAKLTCLMSSMSLTDFEKDSDFD